MSPWRRKKKKSRVANQLALICVFPRFVIAVANINQAHLWSLSTVTPLNGFAPQGFVARRAIGLPADSHSHHWCGTIWKGFHAPLPFFPPGLSLYLNVLRGLDHTLQTRLTCHYEVVFTQETHPWRNKNKCSSAFVFTGNRFFFFFKLDFYKAGFICAFTNIWNVFVDDNYVRLQKKILASINIIWPRIEKRKWLFKYFIFFLYGQSSSLDAMQS